MMILYCNEKSSITPHFRFAESNSALAFAEVTAIMSKSVPLGTNLIEKPLPWQIPEKIEMAREYGI